MDVAELIPPSINANRIGSVAYEAGEAIAGVVAGGEGQRRNVGRASALRMQVLRDGRDAASCVVASCGRVATASGP